MSLPLLTSVASWLVFILGVYPNASWKRFPFISLSYAADTQFPSLCSMRFVGFKKKKKKKLRLFNFSDRISFGKSEKFFRRCRPLPLRAHTSFTCRLFKLKPPSCNLASMLLFRVDVTCHWSGGTNPNIYFWYPWSVASSLCVFCVSPGSHSEKALKFEQRRGDGEPGRAWGSRCTAAHFCPRKQSTG